MIEALWILIFGIIIFALGYLGKAGKYKTLALVAGGLMVLGGAFYPGYGLWEDTFEFEIAPEGAIPEGDIWDVTVANGTFAGTTLTGSAADDDYSITYSLDSDGTHTLLQTRGSANFSFVPTPPAGTSGDDVVTVVASFNENAYVGNNIEVFQQANNKAMVNWSWNGGGGPDTDGTAIMSATWNTLEWAQLNFALDSGAADTFADVYDEVGEQYTVPVTFTCGDWSETLNLIFFVVDDS